MSTASLSRAKPELLLVVLALGCLPAPAFSDEMQYLPDDTRIIASVNLTAASKTRTFKDFLKVIKPSREMEGIEGKWIGKVARVTMGVVISEKTPTALPTQVVILTAIKTLTANDVKALKNVFPFKKNFAYKEIKHGDVTIYQETYQTQVGPNGKLSEVKEGEAFFLVDDRYVVGTSQHLAVLKQIIDRNKAATLTPAMQAGLKEAGFNNIVNVVVDIKNLPARQKDDLNRMFSFVAGKKLGEKEPVGLKLADKVQFLTIKLNEPKGLFKKVATLTCNDADTAEFLKAFGNDTLAQFKEKTAQAAKQFEATGEKLPAETVKMFEGVRAALNSTRISFKGNKVTAILEVEPDIAVRGVMGWFYPVYSSAPPRVKTEEAPRGKSTGGR